MFLLILALVAQAQNVPMRCATPIFDAMKASRPGLLSIPAFPTPAPSAVRPDPLPPPRLGEARLMWLQNMSVMPPQQYSTEVTCRGIGNHCYVMVEDSAWNAGQMDSADVARIIERFDNSSPRDSLHGVWFHNTTVLGQPPDAIDNDSLVYLVYQDVGSFHGYMFDGFWQFFDEYYDTTSMRLWSYHSNEIECVYLDCYPNNPSGDYRIAIAGHEFGHMIHWNYDQAESLWVNEGCAELAMWLFGSPDPISEFNSAPDNDLTRWTGSWADYIKTYLWFLYLYEQYGGRAGTDLIHSIVASPEVSIAGVDSGFAATGLTERFEDVFDDWVLANIVNDTAFLGGRYGYFGEQVPRFVAWAYHSSYPVSRNGSLNRWAGEYMLFQRGRNLQLTFDGADNGNFHLYVVGKDTLNHGLLLDSIPLDSLQYGQVSVPGSDTVYQWVYLVPSNHYPNGAVTYSYTAAATGIEEQPAQAAKSSRARPAVVRAGARLPVAGQYRLYAADGRVVASGDGGYAPTDRLRAGIYWLSGADNSEQGRRLLVVK